MLLPVIGLSRLFIKHAVALGFLWLLLGGAGICVTQQDMNVSASL